MRPEFMCPKSPESAPRKVSPLRLALILLAFGCGSAPQIEGAGGAKGPESPLPEAAKADSQRKPTPHGPLGFDEELSATLDDDHGYHTWTFDLSGDAALDIRVIPHADNLDTVLYLYRRHADTDAWGHYLRRNDDSDGHLWSRIQTSVGAGQYRILVKGYKDALRGPFGVRLGCQGEGCAPTTPPIESAPLPSPALLTQACLESVSDILTAPVSSTSAVQLTAETELDSADLPTRRAVALFGDYVAAQGWSWDALGDPETGQHLLAVDRLETGLGAVTTVALLASDLGAVSFVLDTTALDTAGAPLLLLEEGQDPSATWLCPTDAPPLAEPDARCVESWLRRLPHAPDAEQIQSSAGTAAELLAALPALAAPALSTFVTEVGLDASAIITMTFAKWTAADWGQGGAVTLQVDGLPERRYWVGDTHYNTVWVFARQVANTPMAFVCREWE